MLLKLSKLLSTLAFKLRQKALYFELNYYIKNKRFHLKEIHSYERGFGKTYTLVQLARKYNIPILTHDYMSKAHILHINKNEFKKEKKINVLVANTGLVGNKTIKSSNPILVEEGVSIETLGFLNIKVPVGYKTPNRSFSWKS